MNQRLVIRAAQVALRGLATEAERIDKQLKAAFGQVGLPTPDRTRGQAFAHLLRGYADQLDKQLPRGKP
jgi:hypothetical protein